MRLAREERVADVNKLRIVSLLIDLNPFPQWIKRLDQNEFGVPQWRMMRINAAYERRWGVTREEYENKLDEEVWGPEVAADFAKNDFMAVEQSPEPYITVERVPEVPKGDPPGSHGVEVPIWRIAKVATSAGGEIYVAGIAIRLDEIEELTKGVMGEQV